MLHNTNYGRICRDIIEWPVNVRLELFNVCTFIMLNYSLVYFTKYHPFCYLYNNRPPIKEHCVKTHKMICP